MSYLYHWLALLKNLNFNKTPRYIGRSNALTLNVYKPFAIKHFKCHAKYVDYLLGNVIKSLSEKLPSNICILCRLRPTFTIKPWAPPCYAPFCTQLINFLRSLPLCNRSSSKKKKATERGWREGDGGTVVDYSCRRRPEYGQAIKAKTHGELFASLVCVCVCVTPHFTRGTTWKATPFNRDAPPPFPKKKEKNRFPPGKWARQE